MRKTTYYILIICSLVMITTSACKKCNSTTFFNQYLGVEVGNTWVYKRNLIQQDTTKGFLIVKVLKDTQVNNHAAFWIEKNTNGTLAYYFWHVENEILVQQWTQSPNPANLLKQRLKIGDKWHPKPSFPISTVMEENFEVTDQINFKLLNNIHQAFEIKFGSRFFETDRNFAMQHIFIPYIGVAYSVRQQVVNGQDYIIEEILTDYYTN
jgi:hypothetical protein